MEDSENELRGREGSRGDLFLECSGLIQEGYCRVWEGDLSHCCGNYTPNCVSLCLVVGPGPQEDNSQ